MVNTYAVQSGGCRFESLWGFGSFLKGAHHEVDYCGKKTYLAGLQCTLTSSCAKSSGAKIINYDQYYNGLVGVFRERARLLEWLVFSSVALIRPLLRRTERKYYSHRKDHLA